MKTPFKMKYNTSPIKQKINSPMKQLLGGMPTLWGLGFNPGEDYIRQTTGQPPRSRNFTTISTPSYKIENYMNSGETKFIDNESNYEKGLEEHNNYMQDIEGGSKGRKPENFKGTHSQWIQQELKRTEKQQLDYKLNKRNVT